MITSWMSPDGSSSDMATRATNKARGKVWRARRRRAGVEYLLGYFNGKSEAEKVEQEFDEDWPRPTATGGKKRYQRSDGRVMYV